MGRIRSIKPEFPLSETIGGLSRDARLLFIQLWTFADDSGRARASSRMLASLLYPYDDDAPTLMEEWLDELEQKGCIRLYVAEGNKYLDIPNWLKHQKIERPTPSRIPEFTESSPKPREASVTDLGPRTLDQDLGSGTKEESREGALVLPLSRFDEFWDLYPNKVGKPKAKAGYQKAIRKVPHAVLIDGLLAYRNKTDDRPWCNPATWLNQERWADEFAEVKNGQHQRREGFSNALDKLEQYADSAGTSPSVCEDGGDFIPLIPDGRG